MADDDQRQEDEAAAAAAKERQRKKQEEKERDDKKRAQQRKEYIEKTVPKFDVGSLGQSEIKKLCEDYHEMVTCLNSDIYEWEQRIKKQEYQIEELAYQVNYEGKFMMPALKKINKTERKLAKLEMKTKSAHVDLRENLKSSGKDKWALDEEEKKDAKKSDDAKEEGEGDAAPAEEESAPAEEEEES